MYNWKERFPSLAKAIVGEDDGFTIAVTVTSGHRFEGPVHGLPNHLVTSITVDVDRRDQTLNIMIREPVDIPIANITSVRIIAGN